MTQLDVGGGRVGEANLIFNTNSNLWMYESTNMWFKSLAKAYRNVREVSHKIISSRSRSWGCTLKKKNGNTLAHSLVGSGSHCCMPQHDSIPLCLVCKGHGPWCAESKHQSSGAVGLPRTTHTEWKRRGPGSQECSTKGSNKPQGWRPNEERLWCIMVWKNLF